MITNLRRQEQQKFLADRIEESPTGYIILTKYPEIFPQDIVDRKNCEVLSASIELIEELKSQSPCLFKVDGNKYVACERSEDSIKVKKVKYFI